MKYEGFFTRWSRRAITFPLYALAFLILLALSPALLVIGVAVDLARGSKLAVTRSLIVVLLYLGCELAGLIAAGALWLRGGSGFLDANFRLQWWWAGTLFSVARRLFNLGVEVEGAELARPGPVLILIRHASIADTLLPVALVSRPYHARLRYVLKRGLLWDPCLDVVGNRLPNAFVRRGSSDTARDVEAVQALVDGLGERDGVLLFPEGTRATPGKRKRALEQLAESPSTTPELLERAKKLRHLLPPRLGGVLGLLERNQHADVVFLAHAGFERVHTLADLFNGALVGARVRVKLWRCPRSDIPSERDQRIRWFLDEWQRMDDWIQQFESSEANTPRNAAGAPP